MDACPNSQLPGYVRKYYSLGRDTSIGSWGNLSVTGPTWKKERNILMTESGISVMIMLFAKGNIISRLITFSLDERS